MGVHKKAPLEEVKNLRRSLKEQTKDKDMEKIYYLYFDRIFSIEEIEHYFRGKYTYNEVRAVIKDKYKKYYDKENANGR